jgi:Glycosyl hydrolases family 16
MNVGMDELERLLQKYVSTGAAVVVVILGSGQAQAPATGQPATAGSPTTITVAPGPADTDGGTASTAPDDYDLPDAGGPPDKPRSAAPRATAEPTTAPPALTAAPSTGRPSTGTTGGTAGEGTTAAALHGWGTPTRTEEFGSGTEQWQLYDGTGHAGKGRRSPGAVSVQGGVLTITGDPAGTTGGMAWGHGRRYGRWEGRVRAPASDPSYDAVMLLWSDADNWPQGGEIDFMEMGDETRRTTDGFVHYGADNRQVHGSVETDATQWHNWAVEWTPSAITMFLDGREWYRTTDRAVQPPGPMHLCIQLDWFPKGGSVQRSTMQVDWVREYALDGGSATPGDTAGSAGSGTPDTTTRPTGQDDGG